MEREQARRLVEPGYDAIAEAYLASKDEDNPYLRGLLEDLAGRLPERAGALDLGCGAGIPATRYLARRGFVVTGVDISARQLALARRNVPEAAALLKADMADEAALDFPPASLDAVVSFYAIIHVPREAQPALLARIRRWLRPGGFFLATWAVEAWEGQEANWEGWGAPMWWSHYGEEENLRLLTGAGFEIVFVEKKQSANGETWVWALAQAAAATEMPAEERRTGSDDCA